MQALQDVSISKFKKIEKKLRKFQHIIKKDVGIMCTAIPTKNLVICNAGLVNGLTEETVFHHFIQFGNLTKICLLSGKSCCFLSYENCEASVNAYNAYNGKLNIAQQDKPIYLLFTEILPNFKESKIWEPEKYPSGLTILKDFVTMKEEDELLKLCNFEESELGNMRHRHVKHFGYEFRYDINNVDKAKPLEAEVPTECSFLWQRLLHTDLECKNFMPDQLTINHYTPGQGIPHHVDTHSAFDDPIICLSLKSSIVMEFRNEKKHVCVFLPQRSLLVMSGETRYNWTHSIIPRKYDVIPTPTGYTSYKRGTRISFTFRKIATSECHCIFNTATLENLHVREVYNSIANHFSDTRHKPWPNVLKFVESFEIGSILIDLGCGNGKYLARNLNIFDVGCDSSFELAKICSERGLEIFIANCLNIPLRSEIADGIISIAVIHHLANEARRLQALTEIVRLLKTGGRALIYVWARDQLKDCEKSSYIKQNRKHNSVNENSVPSQEISVLDLSFQVHTNRTQFQTKDVLVPWKIKNDQKSTYFRYYHVFDEQELDSLCQKLPNAAIEKSYYDQGNWCVIIKKISS
ncbi:alkylated DNA repair protein alkB homolog 8 isoform X2 [Cylas formicarius]|uniref:alkylated DNA repair protein alkB homolog 8 isoform X2 n=1 Tax=Cylas formicarius TaxID=197179 RepID=UPI0029584B60|nr:alkylated DNA repair protein alkB homolog 8 isoform X2 [Cylas formicarius]